MAALADVLGAEPVYYYKYTPSCHGILRTEYSRKSNKHF